jgi:hypothetical protein
MGQTTSPISYYVGFSTFTITEDFLPALNTLDFVVHNGPNGNPPAHPGNPVGLRVELSGTATAVPEPASWLPMIVGGMAVFIHARLRGQRVTLPSGPGRPSP